MPTIDTALRCIERNLAWQAALGDAPCRCARLADAPFSRLRRLLAAASVALLTTAAPYQPGAGDQSPGAPYNAAAKFYRVLALAGAWRLARRLPEPWVLERRAA